MSKISSFIEQRYPFDWRTPPNFLVAWTAQCAEVIPTATIIAQILSLIFGSCWLFICMAEDITQDVVEFSFIVTTSTDENRTELSKRFCDLIQIYSDAKEYARKLNSIMSNVKLVVQFHSWSLFQMCHGIQLYHWV